MSTGRVILIGGTVAGVGYALHRYLRHSSETPANGLKAAVDAEPGAEPGAKPGAEANAEPETALEMPSSQQADPAGRLPDVNRPGAKIRINQSRNVDGKVLESPEELLAQAREFNPGITLDVLAGARLIASEHASGSPAEHACIADSECNRAKRRGQTLFESLTRGHGFGKQGRERPASTRRDPEQRHMWISQAVVTGDARGISRGAIRFYDPHVLQKQNQKFLKWQAGGRLGKKPAIVSCNALDLLETWSFDYGRKGDNRCPPDRSRPGRNTLAWVGPIDGIDPLRLLLMKPMPTGPEHTRMYEAARDILKRGL